jgi:hypothetical protein
VAGGDEIAFDLEIVLDDAVVHDDDAALQSRCGCAFFLGRTAVVAHRVWPMPKSPSIGCGQRVVQSRQFAGCAADFH